jgi:hypothetical protein
VLELREVVLIGCGWKVVGGGSYCKEIVGIKSSYVEWFNIVYRVKVVMVFW